MSIIRWGWIIGRLLVVVFAVELIDIRRAAGERVSCGFPGSPSNGSVSVTQNRATFSCDQGFVLFGDLTRDCLPNSTWSGEVPTCDWNIARGQRASQSDTFFNYTADQAVDGQLDTCAFTPRISERRWWQVQLGDTYTVAAVAVTIGTGIPHKFTVFVVSIESGGKLSYELCGAFDGVFETDTVVVVCNQGRGQTGQLLFVRDDRIIYDYFGLCEVEVFRRRDNHPCGKPETPNYTHATVLNDNEIEFDCMKGRQMEGVAKHSCIDGRWKGPRPICSDVLCKVPTQVLNGIIQIYMTDDDRIITGSLANYSCQSGFLLIGDGNRICQDSGTWSGSDPKCAAIDCGPPPPIPRGFIDVNSTLWGAVGIVTCDDGRYIAPEEHAFCSQNKEWVLVNASCQDPQSILAEIELGADETGTNFADAFFWVSKDQRPSNLAFISGGVVVGSVVAVIVTLAGIAMIAYLRKRWILNIIKGSNNDMTKNGVGGYPGTGHSHSNLVDDPTYDDISYANSCFSGDQTHHQQAIPLPKSYIALPEPEQRIYDRPADDEPIYYTPVDVPSSHLRYSAPVHATVILDGPSKSSENPVYEVLDAKGLEAAVYAQVDLEKKKKDREESFRRKQKYASAIDLNPDSGVYENVEFGSDASRTSTLQCSDDGSESVVSVHRPLPPIPSESSLVITMETLDNSDLYGSVAGDEVQQPEDDAQWEKSESIYASIDMKRDLT